MSDQRTIVVTAVLSIVITSLCWSACLNWAIDAKLAESRRLGYIDGTEREGEEHRRAELHQTEQIVELKCEVERLSVLLESREYKPDGQ